MPELGRLLVGLGALLLVVGALLLLGDRLGLGRLPGDITIRRDGVTFQFPLVTCVVVSVVLTLLANLLLRGR